VFRLGPGYRGESFVLTRGGKVVAELVPAPPAGRRLAELPGVLASLPSLGDEEAERFGEDIDPLSGTENPDDPWAS
jgi:antitoxin (DNA-binding transcriptional repressor) of toxin-antitoxin stability system